MPYLRLPPTARWTKTGSENAIERADEEFNAVPAWSGSSWGGPALIRLVGAVLAAARDEWQVSDRRNLSEASRALL